MNWFKVKIPPSTVTEENIQNLQEKTHEITRAVERMEKAVMDGEHQWMLVKCPPAQVPVCIAKPKPEGLKRCTQT